MNIIGSCLCGAVRYKLTAPLKNARSCHCSRCRKAFSSASSAYAEVEANSFRWSAGESHLQRYDSRHGYGLVFCRRCGTTLAGLFEGQVHGITLGTVDGDPGVEIGMHLYVGSRAKWDHIGGDAVQYEEGPP